MISYYVFGQRDGSIAPDFLKCIFHLLSVLKCIHVTSLLFKQRIGRAGSIAPNFLMHVFV